MAVSRELVVDASVVLAVILNESEKASLVSVTRGKELIAPGCLSWEIGNAFSAMLKRNRLDADQVSLGLSTFSLIPVKEIQVNLDDALKICLHHNVYAYDAYYLVVAKRMSRVLLTLDERMRQVAVLEGIKVLEV